MEIRESMLKEGLKDLYLLTSIRPYQGYDFKLFALSWNCKHIFIVLNEIHLAKLHYMTKCLWTPDHLIHMWFFSQSVGTQLEADNCKKYICLL